MLRSIFITVILQMKIIFRAHLIFINFIENNKPRCTYDFYRIIIRCKSYIRAIRIQYAIVVEPIRLPTPSKSAPENPTTVVTELKGAMNQAYAINTA